MQKSKYLFLIFLFVFSLVLASQNFSTSKIGDLKITSQGKDWVITKHDDIQEQYFNINITKLDNKNSQVCFYPKETFSQNSQIVDDLRAEIKNQGVSKGYVEPSDMEKETEKGNLKKICYNLDSSLIDYVKFGNHSTILVYQDIKLINYDLDWAEMNITLFKNVSGEYLNNIEDLFVTYNNQTYKFGANDSNNPSLESYEYEVKSDKEIKPLGNDKFYIEKSKEVFLGWLLGDKKYENIKLEKHIIDFSDICSKLDANCSYELENNTLKVYFNSDKNIDPMIYFLGSTIYGAGIVNNTQGDYNTLHPSINSSSDNIPYNNLVAYWNFEINSGNLTQTFDISSNNYDSVGVTGTSAIYTGNPYGKSLWLNGTSDSVSFGDIDAIAGKNLSVCMWIKPVQNNANNQLIIGQTDLNTDRSFRFDVKDGDSTPNPGGIVFVVFNSAGGTNNLQASKRVDDGNWHHICGTWDGTTQNIYIDGSLNATGSFAGTGLKSSTKPVILGVTSHASTKNWYGGLIDEVMLFTTGLNSTQVTAIYNNQSARYVSEGTFLQRPIYIYEGNNSVSVKTQLDRMNGDGTAQLKLAQWQFSRGYNSDPNIFAWWRFDEETNYDGTSGEVVDSSGNNYNGTATGSIPLNLSEYFYHSEQPDGVQYIELPTVGTDFEFTTNFSVSGWFKTTNEGVVIANYQDEGGTYQAGWRAWVYTGTFYFDIADGTSIYPLTGSTVNDDYWHNFIAVCDASSSYGYLYVDGILTDFDNSFPCSSLAYATFSLTTTPYIGSFESSGTPINIFNGSIDDVIIWNKSLSSEEALNLYTGSLINFDTFGSYQTFDLTAQEVNFTSEINTNTILVSPMWRLTSCSNHFFGTYLDNGQNWTTYTVSGDVTPPTISITSPSNNTNSTDTNLEIDYIASDETALDYCKWSKDGGVTNTTLISCQNITGQTWGEGINTIIIWAVDTTGNQASDSVTFRIDTISPQIQVVYPPNNTNSTDYNLNVNFTYSDSGVGGVSCWWSDDYGATNISNPTCLNLSGAWVEGINNVILYINDSLGNENSTSVSFRIDNTKPFINFTNPTTSSGNYSQNWIYANVSASDSGVGLDTITIYLYNDTGLVNSTTTNPINFTSLSDGNYYLNSTANDTLGNTNSTETRTFILDTTAPVVSLVFPPSDVLDANIVVFIYNVTDTHSIDSCSLYLDSNFNQVDNTIPKDLDIYFIVTDIYESDHLQWYIGCNDSFGNIGKSSIRTLDTKASPTAQPSSGGVQKRSSYDSTLICGKVKKFLIDNVEMYGFYYNYSYYDVVNLTSEINNDADVKISFDVTDLYLENYEIECGEDYPTMLSLYPPSICNLDLESKINIFGSNFTQLYFPIIKIDLGNPSCDSLKFWKNIFKIRETEGYYQIIGLRCWLFLLLIIPILIIAYKKPKTRRYIFSILAIILLIIIMNRAGALGFYNSHTSPCGVSLNKTFTLLWIPLNLDWSLPLPEINMGVMKCYNLDFFRWIFRFEKQGETTSLNGIKIWWMVIGLILGILIYKKKKKKKKI